MTPMHYAVQRGNDRIIEFLASNGAKFDVKNKQGRTPVDFARGRTATLVAKLSGLPAAGSGGTAPATPATPATAMPAASTTER